MEQKITDQYLFKCREFDRNGVIPAVSIQIRNEYYDEIKTLAEKIIQQKGINVFANFFQEGQYLVQLWTAHLIIEDANASEELKQQSLAIIKEYSDNPLVPKVSEQEALWLKKFYPNA